MGAFRFAVFTLMMLAVQTARSANTVVDSMIERSLRDFRQMEDGQWKYVEGSDGPSTGDRIFTNIARGFQFFTIPDSLTKDDAERGRSTLADRIASAWPPERLVTDDLAPLESGRQFPMAIKRLQLLTWIFLYSTAANVRRRAQDSLLSFMTNQLLEDPEGAQLHRFATEHVGAGRRAVRIALDVSVYGALGQILKTSIQKNRQIQADKILSLFGSGALPSTFAKRFVTETSFYLLNDSALSSTIAYIYRTLLKRRPELLEALLDRSPATIHQNLENGWTGSDLARIFLYRRSEDLARLLDEDSSAAFRLNSEMFNLRKFLHRHPNLSHGFIARALIDADRGTPAASQTARDFLDSFQTDRAAQTAVTHTVKAILSKDDDLYRSPVMSFIRDRYGIADLSVHLRVATARYLLEKDRVTKEQLDSVIQELRELPPGGNLETAYAGLVSRRKRLSSVAKPIDASCRDGFSL